MFRLMRVFRFRNYIIWIQQGEEQTILNKVNLENFEFEMNEKLTKHTNNFCKQFDLQFGT